MNLRSRLAWEFSLWRICETELLRRQVDPEILRLSPGERPSGQPSPVLRMPHPAQVEELVGAVHALRGAAALESVWTLGGPAALAVLVREALEEAPSGAQEPIPGPLPPCAASGLPGTAEAAWNAALEEHLQRTGANDGAPRCYCSACHARAVHMLRHRWDTACARRCGAPSIKQISAALADGTESSDEGGEDPEC